MSSTPVILWFRRDLRLDDNTALKAALDTGRPVIPLFIFDPAILSSERLGLPRLKFMLAALDSLATELHKHKRELLVRHGEPVTVLRELIAASGADALYFNIDYTPYARRRDQAVMDGIAIDMEALHDRLLAPPGAILKDDGDPYSVYTPFKRKWRDLTKPDRPQAYSVTADHLHTLEGLHNDGLPTLEALGFEATIDTPEASEAAAHERLNTWINGPIYAYDEGRNRLGNPHDAPRTQTSFLSPYIRFGLISPRRLYWACRDAYSSTESEAKRESVVAFVDEIIWHEFYTHVLYFNPHVKAANFNPKYDAVQWATGPEAEAAFKAWQSGRTGFPVVDAALRQLKATGWMHNRARMIVASFLTKDLLIDWRRGEQHFMQWLLDGDLAANNGGWQWAAGTGTDAQPYFRIFNPVSQSQKFDPDGAFIRRWVSELRDVPDPFIHEPWKLDPPPADYPAPIVDHKAARQRALDAYAATKEA